ncbi:protein SPT2 homolog isoform X2 [Chamaea fasciata]|uniref:protein SPT2 homolog isoform X2 n=1 Tax=Chamaea fasciata TaxID=190680 RepID=UPI00336ACF29
MIPRKSSDIPRNSSGILLTQGGIPAWNGIGGGQKPGIIPGCGIFFPPPETREDRTKRLFRHYTVGSYDNFTSHSDYIIEEKAAVLQKREHEGFGFVLRGAKAETPIEEFTPTPAFPALQYLESVDVEGVAWRAGLRTGDFLIEVNGVNVVKVGHKQVVALIRQGGNRLLMKVVSVSRKPEAEEGGRKKAPPPPKRAPSTTLTLRSKSMTAELEELEALDEMLAAAEPALRAELLEADSRAATVKQRPTSRRISPAEISSLFERQGMAHPGVLAGTEKPHVSLRKGIPRTKSVGEEERKNRTRKPGRIPRERGMGCGSAAFPLGFWSVPWNSAEFRPGGTLGAEGGAGEFRERISGRGFREFPDGLCRGRGSATPGAGTGNSRRERRLRNGECRNWGLGGAGRGLQEEPGCGRSRSSSQGIYGISKPKTGSGGSRSSSQRIYGISKPKMGSGGSRSSSQRIYGISKPEMGSGGSRSSSQGIYGISKPKMGSGGSRSSSQRIYGISKPKMGSGGSRSSSQRIYGISKPKMGSGGSRSSSQRIYGVSKPKPIPGGFLILFPKISAATDPKIGIGKSLTPSQKVFGATDPKIISGGSWTSSLKICGVTNPRIFCGGSLASSLKVSGATDPRIRLWESLTPSQKFSGATDPRIRLWGSLTPSQKVSGASDPKRGCAGSSILEKEGNSGIPGIVALQLLLGRESHGNDVPKALEDVG